MNIEFRVVFLEATDGATVVGLDSALRPPFNGQGPSGMGT